MRIPSITQYKFQTDLMNTQFDKISTLEQKIDTGKNILDSSDDPVLAHSIKSKKDYMTLLESYKKNIAMARNRTALVESSITGSLNSLSRAIELVRAAQTDTANNTDRKNMARELEGLLNNIANFANTRDSNGNYIFAGNNTGIVPFAKVGGSYEYVGSLEANVIYSSPSSTTLYDDSGHAVFGDIKQGNGYYTIRQGSTPNTGTAETTVGTVTSLSAYVEDTYTLSFSLNGAGNLVYQVTGVASGTVIPVSPDPAPEYHSGETISFNGMNFDISGQPNPGDEFILAPSTKQNVLETMNQLINLFNQPITNNVEKAALHQKLSEFSATLAETNSHLTHYLSEVGYRGKELDNQEANSETELRNQEIILGKYESADQAKLISDYQLTMTTLSLTNDSYKKLQIFFEQLLMRGIV